MFNKSYVIVNVYQSIIHISFFSLTTLFCLIMAFIQRKSHRIPQKQQETEKLNIILKTSDLSVLGLCVKNTNSLGRGVFANSLIEKGAYVVEYVGTRLGEKEARKRQHEIGDTGIIHILA